MEMSNDIKLKAMAESRAKSTLNFRVWFQGQISQSTELPNDFKG